MASIRNILLATGLLLSAAESFAAETKVSVPMDYRLIRNVLVNQLYTGEGETARLWKDGKQCSFLDISNPQINGEKGLVKIDNNIHARIGMSLGGKCIPAIEWSGILETFQQPTLDATGNVLSFPVTRATAFDRNGQPLNINQLQDLINKAVQPKLAELKIDLNESRDDITKTLVPYIDADDTEKLHDTVNSLRFKRAEAGDKALLINIGFTGLNQKKPIHGLPPRLIPMNCSNGKVFGKVGSKVWKTALTGRRWMFNRNLTRLRCAKCCKKPVPRLNKV